ncbi:unnamed protein product [Psylliodes chrysocephalus]|nr:unnamed protein product [Psylliodes chrysocephala]
MIDYVKNLESVEHSKILVKDPDELNKKLENFICGGYEHLSIISDYDQTITKQHVNGKSQLHAFGILQRCPSIPSEVYKIVSNITETYKPLDRNLSIPESQRKIFMNEWWTKTIEAYKGLKISSEEMVNTTLKYGPPARDNAKEFFDLLNKANVPVLLISAGVGEFLEPLLIKMNICSPNVELLTNYLKLDEDGKIVGYKASPIHTENKNILDFKNTKFYGKIGNRHNVIVMGDHLGDVAVLDNLDKVENVLKIGFFYGNNESSLPTWLNTYDIVLKDDQTMDVPIAILKLLK